MSKVVIIIVVLAFLFFLDGFFFSKKFVRVDKQWQGYRVVKYSLEHTTYKLLVADTEEKWTKGLMDARYLSNLDGMIFMFPDKAERSFWNERTYMDLDIYWINGEKVVGHDILPSIEKKGKKIINSPKPVNVVIELVR